MLGAIAGDIFGAVFEGNPLKLEDFDLFELPRFFTDDTVLTVATADAILTDRDYAAAYMRWGRKYPNRGYGGSFRHWLGGEIQGPYNSFGNGSAMRVSPVGWAFETLDETLSEATRSASVTHDHPEGIKGAQAVAAAIFLARHGADKEEIRTTISDWFGYDLDRTVAEIRPDYRFDVTCQGSVPEALIAFLDASDFEHAIRLAISLGGDADTQAAIAGSVAEAFWGGVPERIETEVRLQLDDDLLEVVDRFTSRYGRR
jgi:ADP-ribosylglycohydrolase